MPAVRDKIIHFGYFVRAKREKMRLSLSKFGKLAGLSEKRIWQIEKMEKPKSFGTSMEGLAKACGYNGVEEFDRAWMTTRVSVPVQKPRAIAPATLDLPDPTTKGMDFVRRHLANSTLADRVRLLRQLTHHQSRAIAEAIAVRLQEPDIATLPMKSDHPVFVVHPEAIEAPALPVHDMTENPRRRKR